MNEETKSALIWLIKDTVQRYFETAVYVIMCTAVVYVSWVIITNGY